MHPLSPSILYVSVARPGAARAFKSPSAQAITPTLVEETMMPQAVAWSSSANETTTIIGPALGSFPFIAGAQVPFPTCCVLYLCTCAHSSIVRRDDSRPEARPSANFIFSRICYIFAKKSILGAVWLDLFALLLGEATTLLPAYARKCYTRGRGG